jgi:8-oxo-dGTP diphosphatase
VTGRREYPERPMVGVGGVIIARDHVLLIRRGSAPLKGEWSIPGGMLEIGETIVQGVQREMLEETALEVKVLDLIEVFERISIEEDGRAKYHFVILDYLCDLVRGAPRAGSDVTDVAWAAEADLAQFSLTPTATRIIQKAFKLARDRKS